MTYKESLNYLFSQLPMYHRIGAAAYKADLDNTIKLCTLLGNPQNSFKSVHVAGTNGKGSVSHMLASILREKGLKVGLYTSPHLKDFRERIRVNGMKIPKRYVSRFIHKHKEEFEKIQLSFFEMTVGLAFQYFREEKVDIAIVEVGLGGRLDSTNIITPILSVITNISFDHMQLLGDTLEKIAIEKAGIIKPGVPLVIGETQDEVSKIFVEKAKSTGSEIFFADSVFSVGSNVIASEAKQRQSAVNSRQSVIGSRFSAKGIYHPLILTIYKEGQPYMSEVVSPLSGNYQKKNIITVVTVCEMLNKQEYAIPVDAIRKGIRNVIRNTGLKGRWQVLSRNPLTICDTGHNEGGLTEVLAQINVIPHKHLHFVFGVVNDKQIDHILELLPKEAIYYFCKADIPRGLSQDELKKQANAAGLSGNAYPSVKQAFRAAQKAASIDDLIFVGGSTFVVAEVV
jgi:dihydrofolate synthase / folylpolyglutamate synthase